MFPPQQSTSLDIEALSGICGSISIACWVVVFSPQIIENFRRHSADGLSVLFLVVWLAGDLANIIGAVMQGVLPTMIILAVYYTLADIVLLAQVFYYRGFTLSDQPVNKSVGDGEEDEVEVNGETEPLLRPNDSQRQQRSLSNTSSHQQISAAHLSPATPLLDDSLVSYQQHIQHPNGGHEPDSPAAKLLKPPSSILQTTLYNTTAVLLVVAAGILGWYISQSSRSSSSPHHHHHTHDHVNDHHSHHPHNHNHNSTSETLHFDPLGQAFGYLCAALYLGSRIPQLLLNHRRKSTEGVSLLFFLFACLGNLTYDMSIFAYEPTCYTAVSHGGSGRCTDPIEWRARYGRYIAVNASWIVGSLGTLVLDVGIFVQFFLYRKSDQ